MDKIVAQVINSNNLNLLVDFLKIVPGIFVTGFTLYFAYRKVFYRVDIYYSIHGDRISATRIDNIVLVNQKDRPVVLNELVALLGKSEYLSVHKFEPPQILKPLEVLQVNTNPVSSYYTAQDDDFDIMKRRQVMKIFLLSGRKTIPLRHVNSPSTNSNKLFRRKKIIGVVRETFSGIVYNDRVRFFLIYSIDGKTIHTAWIDDGGLIGGDWGFSFNMINVKNINNKVEVKDFINASEIPKQVKYIAIADPREGYVNNS